MWDHFNGIPMHICNHPSKSSRKWPKKWDFQFRNGALMTMLWTIAWMIIQCNQPSLKDIDHWEWLLRRYKGRNHTEYIKQKSSTTINFTANKYQWFHLNKSDDNGKTCCLFLLLGYWFLPHENECPCLNCVKHINQPSLLFSRATLHIWKWKISKRTS